MRSLPFSSLSPPHSLFLLFFFFLSFFFNGDCQISQLSGISEEKKESEEEFAPLFLSTLLSFAGNVDRSTVTANVLDRRKGLRQVPITIEKWVNRRFHFFALLPLSLSFSLSHSRSLLDEFIIGLIFNFEEQLLSLPLFRGSHEYSTRKFTRIAKRKMITGERSCIRASWFISTRFRVRFQRRLAKTSRGHRIRCSNSYRGIDSKLGIQTGRDTEWTVEKLKKQATPINLAYVTLERGFKLGARL